MQMPNYVKEFRRWREAPVSERWLVLRDQAARRVEPGPGFPDCLHDYELLHPTGKRVNLRDPDDLHETLTILEEWQRAIRIAIRASSDG
jgi:hypothetical protein